MTRPEQALLPCPFCGASAALGPYGDVYCTNNPRCAEVDAAVWNRREALLSRAATTQAGEPDAYLVTTRGDGKRRVYATIPDENGNVPSPDKGEEIIETRKLYSSQPVAPVVADEIDAMRNIALHAAIGIRKQVALLRTWHPRVSHEIQNDIDHHAAQFERIAHGIMDQIEDAAAPHPAQPQPSAQQEVGSFNLFTSAQEPTAADWRRAIAIVCGTPESGLDWIENRAKEIARERKA